MSNQKEKVFADGFRFKNPGPNAPDYIVGSLSVFVQNATEFLKTHQKNGWVNLEIKIGRSGNPYVELDTFVPQKKGAEPTQEVQQADNGLPF